MMRQPNDIKRNGNKIRVLFLGDGTYLLNYAHILNILFATYFILTLLLQQRASEKPQLL